MKSELTFTPEVLTCCTLYNHCDYSLTLLVIFERLNMLKNDLALMYSYSFRKIMLSRTKKGYSAVPIGEPFEDTLFWFQIEPFPERVLHETQKSSNWNQKGFSKGFSYGDSRRNLWETFFLRLYNLHPAQPEED